MCVDYTSAEDSVCKRLRRNEGGELLTRSYIGTLVG